MNDLPNNSGGERRSPVPTFERHFHSLAMIVITALLLWFGNKTVDTSDGLIRVEERLLTANALISELLENKVDVSTALAVLASHGVEIESVRDEQSALRGRMSVMQNGFNDLSGNRFYKDPDGNRLEARVTRLESLHLKNDSKL